jgi:MFS family permease
VPDGVSGGESRVPSGFVIRLVLAYLGLYSAILSVALVSLALRIAQADPANRVSDLSVAATLGAFVALFANPLAGRLSDRTTSRWGRRRPWLVGGVLGGAIGLSVVALSSSIADITAGWCLAQLCFNGSISALAAAIPEQVPPSQRGMVSGIIGFSQRLAVPLGMVSVAAFAGGAAAFLLPSVAAIACVCLFALPLKDVPIKEKPPPFSAREFFGSFWINPRSHRDFGWVWLTRFLIYFAIVAPVPYFAYYLTFRNHISAASLAVVLSLLTSINYIASAATAAVCGWLSDRIQRRRIFVAAAGFLLCGGLALLAFSKSLALVFFAQTLLGVGSGLYFAVDMALAFSVLPNSQNVGKDLGVINSADVLPQAIGPAVAPVLLAIGMGNNYAALYLFAMITGIFGIFSVRRIRVINLHFRDYSEGIIVIYEYAYLYITAGREKEFERALIASASILRSADGCQSVDLHRDAETPGAYLLRVGWGTLEDHLEKFPRSEQAGLFAKAIEKFFDHEPDLRHFYGSRRSLSWMRSRRSASG